MIAHRVTQKSVSTHGALAARNDPNGPTCKECHGTHGAMGKLSPASPTFPTNVPLLCAKCHREGQKAAVRYGGAQHEIIEHYTESNHGKRLMKSGLTVTATCTNCHSLAAVAMIGIFGAHIVDLVRMKRHIHRPNDR